MTYHAFGRAILLASCALSAVQPLSANDAQSRESAESILTDAIIVSAPRNEQEAVNEVTPPQQIALPADAVTIAARTPGGAHVGNGALSGQLSYRGLAGQRVVGRVNGQRFASGGPNAMDPPLHYAPSILVDRIEIARGVAPVSQGPSLAGAVDAQLVQTGFSEGGDIDPQVRLVSQYRSVDNSDAIGGLAGIANENWRLGVIASREEGDDYEFPSGTAVGTSFERNLYGIHGGFQTNAGELYVEYRRNETDPTGNPPFALDIVYFNTDFIQGGFRGDIAKDVRLDLKLGHVAIRHLMDNQTTRSPAAPAMRARATFADADTTTGEASLRFGNTRSYVQIGADIELTDKFVRITNPFNPGFFLDSQPDVTSERVGAFVQWRSVLGGLQFELGGRFDQTDHSAGLAQLGTAIPMGPRILASAFNSADRDRSETTFDGVLRSWFEAGDITPRLTLARKERVPNLLERFGWLPTPASFGLADGNIYVGDLDIKPETAWIAELGFDYEDDLFTMRPTVFYRRVDDFIQGVPFDDTPGIINTPVEQIAAMNGDSTPLRFGNVDAELYGADLDFSLRPMDRLELSGTASYVRGKRRDIDDGLYRIAPANLTLSAIWQGDGFALGAEMHAASKQNRISQSNDEERTSGYAIVGLFGQLELGNSITLDAGVENLFDKQYSTHLAGRSRVGASDVPTGTKLPGVGRGAWLRLTAGF